MTIRAAFATDEGERIIDRHFGDANFYDIYDISENNSIFLKRITNTKSENKSELHADPEKAVNIANLLESESVNTAAAKIFGPNIKRIRKKFVCVLVSDKYISEAISILQDKYSEIESEWFNGENRLHLNFKKQEKNNE